MSPLTTLSANFLLKDNKNFQLAFMFNFSAKLSQFQIHYFVKCHSLVIRLNTQHVTDSISYHSVICWIQNCTVNLFSLVEKKSHTEPAKSNTDGWPIIQLEVISIADFGVYPSVHSLLFRMDIN